MSQPSGRSDLVSDLSVLIKAYGGASPEQRERALAMLQGQVVESRGTSDEAEEQMLNQQEVAYALHVHPTTVRRWKIPCQHLGRVPRYSMPEVRAYLGSNEFKQQLAKLKKQRARE